MAVNWSDILLEYGNKVLKSTKLTIVRSLHSDVLSLISREMAKEFLWPYSIFNRSIVVNTKGTFVYVYGEIVHLDHPDALDKYRKALMKVAKEWK